MSNRHGPLEEFNALRQELDNTRQFVFERPLFIVTASAAAIALVDKPFFAGLPPVAVGLLLANLWFTVDRMQSLSRIAAYIEIELEPGSEEKDYGKWVGWETCLRAFRSWIVENKENLDGIIAAESAKLDHFPVAAGYYPTILWMHVVASAVALLISLAYAVANHGAVEILAFFLTLALVLWLGDFGWRNRPEITGRCIGETRIIWEKVFQKMQDEGIK
jgi:hypothetical protein